VRAAVEIRVVVGVERLPAVGDPALAVGLD